jgi:hypothetical protein
LTELLRRHREALMAAAALLALTIVYAWMFLPYLAAGRTIGNDYSIYFPTLLAGYYWFVQNGPFAIPWFSPSECGGFPYFPDPNAAYVSAPQALTFAVGPLAATRIVLIVFAMLGFAGFALLMRKSFRASLPASLMAAAFFMFNGYFVYRHLAGHLTFHASMLTPWVAFAVLTAPSDKPRASGSILRICLAGAAFAYMYQAGMIHGILPALLAVAILLLIHACVFGWRAFPWAALVLSGVLMLALCAEKFAAGLALAHQFPRTEYALPGLPDPVSLIETAFRALFWRPPSGAADLFVNRNFAMERHEWEYGVSPAPLLIILGWLAAAVIRRRAGAWPWPRLVALAAAFLLSTIPLALNFYTPDWNEFLKGLPFFGSSSQLIRWFSAYIPVFTVLSGLALDRIRLPENWLGVGALAGVVAMLFWNLTADRSFYADQHYDPSAIDAAYMRTAEAGVVPPIRAMGAILDSAGRLQMPIDRNDLMVNGVSQIACYQPIMGYGLESFPVKSLHAGSATSRANGVLNVKNPACYLFPAENHCEPGDQFAIADREDAFRFLAYKPYDFAMPTSQKLADGVSLLALIGLIVAPSVIFVRRLARR